MKLFVFLMIALSTASDALATGSYPPPSGPAPMLIVKWSMITLCFTIGILSQIASGAVSGETRLNWGQLLARLLAVVILVESAGRIQGFIWGSAESIGDHLMPGPTLSDLNTGFAKKVQEMQAAKTANPETGEKVTLGSILTDPKLMFNLVADAAMQAFEHISLTILFLAYKTLQSAQKAVMMFLAGMAPFILPASIIPGVNSWSSWLKMVISVALWPVVAGFMIKGQFMSASEFLSGSPGTGGAVTSLFSSDLSNFFLNMDSLQLFAQSVFYGMMLLASPFIASALVYGSAQALASGGALLISRPTIGMISGTKNLVTGKLGERGIFGPGGNREGSGRPLSHRGRNFGQSRSARYLPRKGGRS